MLTLVATISGKEVTTTYSAMSALKSYIASKRITTAVLSGKSERATDTMYDLFASSLSYLTSLDLSGLDFSNITNTSGMLSGCNRLTSLTFPTDIDTSKITNMSYMFRKCDKLTTIDVSKFNTSNVTNMSYMFNDCNLITSLDLSNFDTSKVTDMSYMFNNCYALQVDISNFDTSKVTNMSYMFSSCSNLTSFNVTNFNLSSVTNMSFMFSNCTSLASIDLSKLEAPKVINISYIFNNCKVMTSAKLFKTTNTLTYINGLFALCYVLKEFDITQLNTENVISMADMFSGCRGLVSLDLYYLNTQNVTSMYAMFKECNSISSLDISRFKTSKVTSTSYMFYRCYNLTEIDIQPLDLSNLTDTSYMFNNCSKLTTIYSKDFDTSKITNSAAMFTNSTKLKNYDSTKIDAQYANIETGYFTYKPSYTIPFISNIDMNTNEIKNQVVHNLKHAPENPVKGQIYFDTLTNKLYYFDGTDWTTTGVQKEITGDTLPVGSIVKFDGDTIPANWEEVAGGEIIDNLNSTSAIDALSANQGRILKEFTGNLGEVFENFNNYKINGRYRYNGNAETLNKPNYAWGILEVITTYNYILQRVSGNSGIETRISYDSGNTWTDWKYVNCIFNSGSNTNGNWIQYTDGTMICSADIDKTLSMNTMSGPLYTATDTNIVFPQPFIEVPSVIVNTCDVLDYSYAMVYGMVKSKTGITTISFLRTSARDSARVVYNYIARGKWR